MAYQSVCICTSDRMLPVSNSYMSWLSCSKGQHPQQPAVLHRFGVVIAARNERVVLPNLIRSIQEQSYPRELVDIFCGRG